MADTTRTKADFAMLVDGAFVGAADDRRLDRVDPFTLESLGTIPDAGESDVDAAIAAARRAFDGGWGRSAGITRVRLLLRVADLLDERAELLGRLETLDNGKPIAETVPQIRFAASIYRFYAGYADKLYGRQIPMDRPDRLDYTLREPVGVVGLITAWNSPMQLLANKLAPALAAGNAAVVKPSEFASASTLEFGRLLLDAGLPPGVVNIVSGGATAGARLSSSTGVDHLSFTGSVPTGRRIATAAAANLVPTTLELGGKSPNIIFDDASLDHAVAGGLVGIFSAGGQTCIAGSRLLVQRGVYAEVVQRLADRAAQIRLGDPLEPRTQMGPVANRPQFDRVRSMVDSGRQSGANLLTGADPLTAPLDRGLFVRPSVFADVRPDMAIAQQEIFGPVLSVIPFDDEDEAVRIANGTAFGLASAVWTQNLGRAHRMARALVAGTVWVNTYRESAAGAPFGGTRQSGYGRERGEEALHEFLRTKNVMVNFSTAIDDPFAA